MNEQLHLNAQRMMDLFEGHPKAHGTHGKPERDADGVKMTIRSTARTLREPVTVELWEQHLRGERPLGVVPIRADGTCGWASIDVDRYDINILDIVEEVDRRKIPLVPCRSKSGGLHLFLFLVEPQPAAAVQAALRETAAALGLGGCEIFPKQTAVLAERGDVGNWMVMPYYGDTYGGTIHVQAGLRHTGAELDVQEFLHLAEERRVGRNEFEALSRRGRKVAKITARSTSTTNAADAPYVDGPPCIQSMAAAGVAEHAGRNNALFHFAVYARKKWPNAWERKLEEFNQSTMLPPLLADEVVGITRSLGKKDYGYKCVDQPMCALCDRPTCLTRPHGVAGDAKQSPVIVRCRKLNLEEPVWFVKVSGSDKEVKIERIDDLTNCRRFCDQCAKQVDRFFTPVKSADWAAHLREKESEIIVEEPPEDITERGAFHELLKEFLTNRQRGKMKEDILSRRPWEDAEAERHYFQMRDLHQFVMGNGMRDVSRHDCQKWIRELGGDRHITTIKAKSVRLWWVPSAAVVETPPADLPQPLSEQI